MFVAITSQGPDLQSAADDRFGRCSYFIIYNMEDEKVAAVIDNQTIQNQGSGAGLQAAQAVANENATAVLTGHVGPKAFSALHTAGVKIYLGEAETVQGMIDKFKANELEQTDDSDVNGHWK